MFSNKFFLFSCSTTVFDQRMAFCIFKCVFFLLSILFLLLRKRLNIHDKWEIKTLKKRVKQPEVEKTCMSLLGHHRNNINLDKLSLTVGLCVGILPVVDGLAGPTFNDSVVHLVSSVLVSGIMKISPFIMFARLILSITMTCLHTISRKSPLIKLLLCLYGMYMLLGCEIYNHLMEDVLTP